MNENAALFFVDRHVDSHINEKKAFIEYGSKQKFITYADLYEQSSKLRHFFSKFKINREDRVIILMQDVISYPIIFWGCLKSGVIPVLLNTLLSSDWTNMFSLTDENFKISLKSKPLWVQKFESSDARTVKITFFPILSIVLHSWLTFWSNEILSDKITVVIGGLIHLVNNKIMNIKEKKNKKNLLLHK